MFSALEKRSRARQKAERMNAGAICATVANFAPLMEHKRTFYPWDFLPDLAPPKRTASADEMWQAVATIHHAITGEKSEA